MNNKKLSLVEKIKYWKDFYNKTPNGYWLAQKIGEEYISDISKVSFQKRKSILKDNDE